MTFIVRSGEMAKYGKYPGSRSVEELLSNGIVILDKWQGPTSHDVASIVKKVLGRSKAGHAGTLDPMVSGVLVIAMDNACKVLPALQKQDKEYVGVMHLHKDVDDKKLAQAIKKITGEITQRPPVRSAVARKERKRNVYSFNVLERNGSDVLFRVRCEAGTYVRLLCHKIGENAGGAHMKELRRTAAGIFSEARAVKIHDLADAYADWQEHGSEALRDYVLPVEAAVEGIGKIIIKDSAVYSVSKGSPLYGGGVSRIESTIKKGDLVALMTLRGELVSLAHAEADTAQKGKNLVARVDRVIMTEGYPKIS